MARFDKKLYAEFVSYVATVYPRALLNSENATKVVVNEGQPMTFEQTEIISIMQCLTIPLFINSLIDFRKEKEILELFKIAVKVYPCNWELKEYLQRHRKLETIKEATRLMAA